MRNLLVCLAAVAAALSCSSLACPPLCAEEPAAWKVGLARVKITPEGPIWMAGYAARKKPSEGVLADLYAKAMAVEDSGGRRAVLVTADVISFGKATCEAIAAKIGGKTGLKREQILLCPSHTHTGPVLGLSGQIGYDMPEDQQKVVFQYTEKLVGQLGEVSAAAVADLKPARLSWGRGVVHFPMNRREFTDRGVVLGVNPSGYADRSVPVLRVDDAEGKPRAVLFGCACHNTTLTGEHYVLSGDYAGFAQAHVEKELPGVQAMFMIGCGGDANPYPRSQVEHVKQHGAELGGEVCRVAQGKLQPVRGPLATLLEAADAPLEPVPPREKLVEMAKGPYQVAYNAKKMLAALDKNEPLPATYPVPIAVWQFGEDLTLVAISGEVLSGYVTAVEKAVGPLRLWVAAYTNEVFGYLPTAEALAEGGYETRGLYGPVGFFSPKAQDVVVAKVRELAEQAARKK